MKAVFTIFLLLSGCTPAYYHCGQPDYMHYPTRETSYRVVTSGSLTGRVVRLEKDVKSIKTDAATLKKDNSRIEGKIDVITELLKKQLKKN